MRERRAAAEGSRRGGASEAGVSMVEALVVLVILVVAMAVFYEMILGSMRASMFTESRNDLAAIGQRVVNRLQTEIIQSKLVFEEDPIGAPYRSLFASALPPDVSMWPGSRLPILDAGTTLIGPDPGPSGIANRTGNSLLLARQLAPIPIPYDHDGDPATPDVSFLADMYEFQLYFLHANPSRNFAGRGHYLDVLRARSQTFADQFQLAGVPVNGDRVIEGIVAQTPVRMAWNPGKPLDGPAFYELRGGALVANPSPKFVVSVESLVPEFRGGRVAGAMEYSVGFNTAGAPGTDDPVPRYALAGRDFPHGLEVMVVGPSGHRKVLTRLVLASESGGRISTIESSVISSARGF